MQVVRICWDAQQHERRPSSCVALGPSCGPGGSTSMASPSGSAEKKSHRRVRNSSRTSQNYEVGYLFHNRWKTLRKCALKSPKTLTKSSSKELEVLAFLPGRRRRHQ